VWAISSAALWLGSLAHATIGDRAASGASIKRRPLTTACKVPWPASAPAQDGQNDDEIIPNFVRNDEWRDDEFPCSSDASWSTEPGIGKQRADAFVDTSSNTGGGDGILISDVRDDFVELGKRRRRPNDFLHH
jgi:hypothetical protein